MAYIIEGTVTEISSDGTFRIAGSEGYAIKQGDKKYNVIYSEDLKTKADTNAVLSFIFFDTRDYSASEKFFTLLSSAMTSGNRIRVTIEATEDEIKTGKMPLSVSSITVFSN